jgi:hypothetical protein
MKPNLMQTIGIFVLVYVTLLVLGNHRDSYWREPAKLIFVSQDQQIKTEWTCPNGEDPEQNERWDEHTPVCHIPATQCPWPWFPVATVSPCPYKDPLRGFGSNGN